MSSRKNDSKKVNMHLRNKNRERYDLKAMVATSPELKQFIQPNKVGEDSINFSKPEAVKALNTAILQHYYGIDYWDFPKENLCPAIPGRAEYIHHMADLLTEYNDGKMPRGNNITCLDVGTGASCVYPIIGVTEYDWNFIGSEIDDKSLDAAQRIVDDNPMLRNKIALRKQDNFKRIFGGILNKTDQVDMVICNPPFHASVLDARKGSRRKVKNLTGQKTKKPELNFSGNRHELVYKGGEYQFICNMITESKVFAKQCFWFSTLVSKESNLKKIYQYLERRKPTEVGTIDIKTGNKTGRIVAWTYFTDRDIARWQRDKRRR
ncbi:MAG: 23S rRNA (adenine(1618)-N(6))-methyltransferase RlmF [Chitinophagales bacterium]